MIEGLKQLPVGWEWKTLGAISEINPRRPQIVRANDIPTSFVPMAFVDEKEGKIANLLVRPYGDVRSGYTYFEENDVLLAKITPSMENGKAAIAKGLIDNFGFGTTEFHVFRPVTGISSEWIFHYLRQISFRNEAKQHFRGAVGQQRVPQDFLEPFPIPIPYPNNPEKSLIEQRRIVARIESLLTEVREARRLNDEIGESAGVLMESTRHQVFSALRENAPIQDFDEVTDSRLGKMLSEASKTGEHSKLYLRNANVLWDDFLLDDLYEMDFLPEEREKYQVLPGDLLICEGGEIGRTAVWDGQLEEIYFQKAIHRARLRNSEDQPRYLMHFMAWAAKNGAIAELMTGAAIPHLTGVKLKTLKVLWPKPIEQRSIVAYLDTVSSEVKEMYREQTETETLLTQCEQAILAQAFRGEL